ncbi:MAG: ABC-2 transporter permease [Lachnospiraceae bacterium]|jgi:hypothetical protein|nr:ABC-2 transporter permease [Lachnospiraceae bacterium]
MNKLSTFVRLDLLTTKAYMTVKMLLFFVVIEVFIIFFNGPALGIGTALLLAVVVVSYPFAIGEKSNMDALYITLSVDHKTVVGGRYLFALAVNLSIVAATLVVALAAMLVRGEAAIGAFMREVLATTALILAFTLTLQVIQFPMYFKYGYTKAKFISLVPVFALIGGLTAVAIAAEERAAAIAAEERGGLSLFAEWLVVFNRGGVIALAAAAVATIVFVSYRLSVLFYGKREF